MLPDSSGSSAVAAAATSAGRMPVPGLSPTLFKAYDIRGIIGETLDPVVAYRLGFAFARLAIERERAQDSRSVAIGRDGRLSGPSLMAGLAAGLRAGGLHVIDVGRVTTPMVYFAAYALKTGSAIAVTGSHNPPNYNGFKLMLHGETLHGESIQQLYRYAQAVGTPEPQTTVSAPPIVIEDVAERYIDRIVSDVRLARPLRVAVDAGNGVAGAYAPRLFERLGCAVVPLYCEVDGNFPNHHPDPADPDNLQALIDCLRQGEADIGLAFDGDGDRLGVVTADGQIIWPDRQLILLARAVLTERPGATILFDVKCSRHVERAITEAGGRSLMWRTGHSLIKAKLRETGAALAGEMSGHIFFNDRWYGFDDGLYAGARLLEVLSRCPDPSAALNALPNALCTPELKLATPEGEHVRLVAALQQQWRPTEHQRLILIDGLRVEYEDGFGLARPSNTTPVVVLRFEADSALALARIQEDFRRAFLKLQPDLNLPF